MLVGDFMKIEERIEVGTGKVSSTGSIVIPLHIREKEGLKTGDRVSIVDIDGKIFIQKPNIDIIKQAVKEIEKVGKL